MINVNVYIIILLQNFTKADGGVYKVIAKNDSGEGTASITINLDAGYVFIKFTNKIFIPFLCPPFEEEVVYCLAQDSWLVHQFGQ